MMIDKMENDQANESELFLKTQEKDKNNKDYYSKRPDFDEKVKSDNLRKYDILRGAVLITATCLTHFLSSGVSFSIGKLINQIMIIFY